MEIANPKIHAIGATLVLAGGALVATFAGIVVAIAAGWIS